MKIENTCEGIFVIARNSGEPLENGDSIKLIAPELARFRKEHPELRIVSVSPLIETIELGFRISNKQLANVGYMIITEPALPQNMPCGCRCLIHGNVDDC